MLTEIRAGVAGLAPAAPPRAPEETIHAVGRFKYREGLADVWLGDEHYNLRGRTKAQLCLEFLLAKQAFAAASARHFLDEIDPYVRAQGRFLPAAEIKIDHYFTGPRGRLAKLRKDLIIPAGRNGRFYLQTN